MMALKDECRHVLYTEMDALYGYIRNNSQEEVKKSNLNDIRQVIGDIKDNFDYLTYEDYVNILKEIEIINTTTDYTEESKKEEFFTFLETLRADSKK